MSTDNALAATEIRITDLTVPASFEGRNSEIPAFFARPAGGEPRGGVIVVHEAFGLTEHIRDVTTRYAREGYAALAPDFFHRQGIPPSLEGGFGPLREFMGKVPDAQVLADLDAASIFLRSQAGSNGKVGIVGYCWGGRVSMLAATRTQTLDAACAYYGRVTGEPSPNQPRHPLDLVAAMSVPLQGHFGALDQGIPVAGVEELREALKAHGKTAEIYVYADAGHAFNNDDRPEMYHAETAQLAFRRTLDWFGRFLSG